MKLFGIKIDLNKVANAALKIGTTAVFAAVAHKAVTGKLDIKAAVVSAVRDELSGKSGA